MGGYQSTFDPEANDALAQAANQTAVGSLSDPGSDETGAGSVGTDPRFDPAAFDRALEAQNDPYINPHPDESGDDGFDDPFGNVASSTPVLDQGQSLIDPPELDDPTGGQAPPADGADLMEV